MNESEPALREPKPENCISAALEPSWGYQLHLMRTHFCSSKRINLKLIIQCFCVQPCLLLISLVLVNLQKDYLRLSK